MDINVYIQQARSQGQTDGQIRQALQAAGWPGQQIDAVLGPAAPSPSQNTQTVQNPFAQDPDLLNNPSTGSMPLGPGQQRVKKNLKVPAIVLGALASLVIIGVGIFVLFGGQKTTYQTAIQQFITALQDKNKAKADALESPAAQATLKKETGTTSFYSSCQQEAQFCTAIFSASFLNKATKTYKDYTASNGTKGKEVVYTQTQSSSQTGADGSSCTIKSTTTLTISAVPKGNSWLIDDVNEGVNAGGNLCPVSGGTTSVGN